MNISKKVLATLLSALTITTAVTPITASATEQPTTDNDTENVVVSDITTDTTDSEKILNQDLPVISQSTNNIRQSQDSFWGLITFEIPENWRNKNSSYYAHIWDGLPEGKGLYDWQSSAELMTVNSTETKATYNIPQGNWNLIIISGNSGIQTFDSVFNKNCVGDTCYVDEEKFENPSTAGKGLTALLWKNNPDCGPHKTVTSLGKVIGSSYLPGETNQDLYNNFVDLYKDNPELWYSAVGANATTTWEEIKAEVATELGVINEVTSIKLNKTSLSLGAGETATLTATASSANATLSYTWSSSNTSIATVNNNGKITAKTSGTAYITVKANNGKTATCKLTVKSAPTSVKLSTATKTLGAGETFIISQSTNSGSYASTFTWSSNNNSVATVRKTTGNKAMITAKSVGTANITIKTYNGKTATCKVTVKPAPTSVKLSTTSKTLGVGETFIISQSSNSGSYASTFTWSSNNNNIATVEKTTGNKAMITAKNVGTANITIRTYNGKTATCKVTVKPAPTSVKLSTTSKTLGVGETFIISQSSNAGSYASTFSWSSRNESVATVKKTTANKAQITANSLGTAYITIKTYNGKTATCKVTVKPAPTSVKVSTTSKTLGVGETFTISQSSNSGSYASTFTWNSNNTNVATVKKSTGNKAIITAKKIGTTNITIRTYNGKTATCKVTVKPAPTSVKVSAISKTLGVGETFTISQSSNSGSYASTFTWISDNTNIATVEKSTGNKAIITAKNVGTANITVKTYNGKTATCTVTVRRAPSKVILSNTEIDMNIGQGYIVAQSTDSGTYASTFTWSSSNNNVATVKKTKANKAMIIAKGVGTATITIRTYNGKTATCRVNVERNGYSYAYDLVHNINRERYYAGVEQIPVNELACDIANVRAKELAQKFDVMRPNGTYINTLATDMGLNYEYVIELVGYQESDIYDLELYELYVDDDNHYEILTLSDIESVGVGKYLASNGNTYWSIIYVI